MPFASETEFTITQVGRELWRLEKHVYYYGSKHIRFTWIIPSGVVYDGSSIPRPVWSLIGHPLWGEFGICGFLHDDMYRRNNDRKESDLVYVEALASMGAPAWKRSVCYWALRAFGWIRYKKT